LLGRLALDPALTVGHHDNSFEPDHSWTAAGFAVPSKDSGALGAAVADNGSAAKVVLKRRSVAAKK
jgi:hypothetical protein